MKINVDLDKQEIGIAGDLTLFELIKTIQSVVLSFSPGLFTSIDEFNITSFEEVVGGYEPWVLTVGYDPVLKTRQLNWDSKNKDTISKLKGRTVLNLEIIHEVI